MFKTLEEVTVNSCGIDCGSCPSRKPCIRWHGQQAEISVHGKLSGRALMEAQQTFARIRPRVCLIMILLVPVARAVVDMRETIGHAAS